MPYVDLSFPPGMHANGTPYLQRGKWYIGDRVRWQNGALRPIGGWSRFTHGAGTLNRVLSNPSQQSARTILGWRANDGGSLYAVGHNQGVMAFNRGSANVYDITPVGFTPKSKSLGDADGYGNWFYGSSEYGTRRPYDAGSAVVFNWCFRTWGEHLLAAERGQPSRLYAWPTGFSNKLVQVPNAPIDFDCFHVTQQRIVMVGGSASEPRLISWSDSEDREVWTPALDNQAGFQTLPGVGRIREIIEVQDQILILTETDAHVATYVGPPYIYSFDQIGADCGVGAGASVVAAEDFVVWPGKRDFFVYDGTVRRLECSVMDRIAELSSTPQAGKTVGFVNSDWAEVWWLYQSINSQNNEVDSYVAWDWKENHWHTGTLDRTVGGVHPSLNGPVMIGSDGYAYNHELEGVLPVFNNLNELYIESGPVEIAKGDLTSYIKAIQPDMVTSGQIKATLIGQDRPGGPEVSFGPYLIDYPATSSQPVATRARGHTVRLRIEANSGLFTLGTLRLDANTGGSK